MHEILRKIGEIGVIPVIKIEKACDAVSLGKALLAGELPVAEITFRTAAAEEAIKNMTRELPNLLVGAGTVLERRAGAEGRRSRSQIYRRAGLQSESCGLLHRSRDSCNPGNQLAVGDRDGPRTRS